MALASSYACIGPSSPSLYPVPFCCQTVTAPLKQEQDKRRLVLDMATITRVTLRPYAALGKSNSKIQNRISELLFRLVQTDNPAKVKRLACAW